MEVNWDFTNSGFSLQPVPWLTYLSGYLILVPFMVKKKFNHKKVEGNEARDGMGLTIF